MVSVTSIGLKADNVSSSTPNMLRWIDSVEWEKYQNAYNFYFAEFDDEIKNYAPPFTFFLTACKEKWEMYHKKFGIHGRKNKLLKDSYTLDYLEYSKEAKIIHNTLKAYNYSMFNIRKNKTFNTKEFGQLVSLLKDVYINGTYNFSTYYITTTEKYSKKPRLWFDMHPGKHLNFIKNYLGLPINGWFSIKKEIEDLPEYKVFSKFIKTKQKVKKIKDIEDISGYPIQSCFIETAHHELAKPGIFLKIPLPNWNNTDENGHHRWPDLGQYYGHYLSTFYKDELEIIDDVINAKDKYKQMEKYVKVKKKFKNETITINNFTVFILCELDTDQNFERI